MAKVRKTFRSRQILRRGGSVLCEIKIKTVIEVVGDTNDISWTTTMMPSPGSPVADNDNSTSASPVYPEDSEFRLDSMSGPGSPVPDNSTGPSPESPEDGEFRLDSMSGQGSPVPDNCTSPQPGTSKKLSSGSEEKTTAIYEYLVARRRIIHCEVFIDDIINQAPWHIKN